MEFGAATQSLPGPQAAGIFAGVVDQCDGEMMLALKLAQEAEQWSDLAGVVLVDGVQAHKRVEHEQRGIGFLDGFAQLLAAGRVVQTQPCGGDDEQRQVFQSEAAGGGDACESFAHDVQRVFGGKEQHPGGASDREAAEALGAGSDRDGQIEGEKGLAARARRR
ncbi:MAG: hypothetical protein U0587_18685 [Candidatus Binatia bacterium]